MEKNFEDSLKRLETIVNSLESGIDELDMIVTLFEEGSELVKYCSGKLEKIENKIKILSKKIDEPVFEE
ncbi:MAG: exodeoxyribonuclease VII small subunit [Candidatus Cloacimonetes bacterium]|nr:exodeoxyribonuclease VII small subunit [Candidatus Cloacimonadota bacterium]